MMGNGNAHKDGGSTMQVVMLPMRLKEINKRKYSQQFRFRI